MRETAFVVAAAASEGQTSYIAVSWVSHGERFALASFFRRRELPAFISGAEGTINLGDTASLSLPPRAASCAVVRIDAFRQAEETIDSTILHNRGISVRRKM